MAATLCTYIALAALVPSPLGKSDAAGSTVGRRQFLAGASAIGALAVSPPIAQAKKFDPEARVGAAVNDLPENEVRPPPKIPIFCEPFASRSTRLRLASRVSDGAISDGDDGQDRPQQR